jgi:hypothetical protein
MRALLIVFLLSSCSSLPNNPNPKTIAAGASGRVDYCVSLLGASLFCINAKRQLEDAD